MTVTEKTQAEKNREHCKHIAEEIEKVAHGAIYRCPECGAEFEYDPNACDDDTFNYTCPECEAVFPEEELEQVTLLDYFEDVLDIEYRVGSDKELRSVCLCVAFGGPTIYVDTNTESVELKWWNWSAWYPIRREVCRQIEDEFEELYNC